MQPRNRSMGGGHRTWAALAVLAALGLSACSSSSSPLAPNTPVVNEALTVSGSTLFTAVGQTSQFTVTDATGAVPPGITWVAPSPGVATVSPTGLVTATGFGTAAIQVKGTNATGQAMVYVAAPATTQSTLSACGPLSGTKSYVLQADLVATGAGSCVALTTIASVQLDCRGHLVPSLSVSGANSVTISNCSIPGPISISGATGITLNNVTAAGGVNVVSSSNVTVMNSTISAQANKTSPIQAITTTGLRAQGNTVNAFPSFYGFYLFGGSNNQVVQNTILGGYDGGLAEVGSDDGVIMINETSDTVQGNAISNFFDAGVEGVDLLANTTIADNTMTNVGAAGVGSYWCTNWTNNVVRNNTVSQAPLLLYVTYSIGLGQCGTAALQSTFSNNQFIGNHYRTPIPGTIGFVPAPKTSVSTQNPIARMIVQILGPTSNNLVQGNDLGTNDGPYFATLSGFVDGGGNLCGPTNSTISNFPCAGVGSTSLFTRRR